MLKNKTFLIFILSSIVLYSILISIGYNGLDKTYSNYFIKISNIASSYLSPSNSQIQVSKNTRDDKHRFDVHYLLMNAKTIKKLSAEAKKNGIKTVNPPAAFFTRSSFRQGYVPTILLFSLIFAVPIVWRSKLMALLWGSLLIHAYILFKIALTVLYQYNVDKSRGIGVGLIESEWGRTTLEYLHTIFVQDMPLRIIIPIMIWFFVCFNKNNLQMLKNKLKLN